MQQLERARRQDGIAVFSDFDGTLAPIVRHPHQARLPAQAQEALRRLARRHRVALGIVSGRALSDLRRRAGVEGLWLIGSHGEEWRSPDGRVHSRASARLRRRIQELHSELASRLADLSGVYIERKTVSVAVHYRNARPEAAAKTRRAVADFLRKHGQGFRVLEGKKVREILPAGNTSKGETVFRVLARMARAGKNRPRLLYLGDDQTDETVFQRLGHGDLGIHIGRRGRTRATYRLASPAEAARFLERLAEALP